MRVSTVFSSGTSAERQPGGSPPPSYFVRSKGGGENTPRCRRLWTGIPEVGEGWSVLAENNGWLLQVKPPIVESDWVSLKLVSKISRAHSANFWLAWNGERFADSKEMDRLLLQSPEMAEWVAGVLMAKAGE